MFDDTKDYVLVINPYPQHTDSGESEDAPSEAAAAPDHIGRAVFAGGG